MVLFFPELIIDLVSHRVTDARRFFAAVVISNFMKLTRESRENVSFVDIHGINRLIMECSNNAPQFLRSLDNL